MQNRLATAILMAVGGALADQEHNGTWEASDIGDFLEDVSDNVTKLLKGEVVHAADYPPMQLTGSNMVQSMYNTVAAEFLKADTIAIDQGGYNE